MFGLFGKDPNPERRMELTEHLAELRARLIRSILYMIVGAIIAYQFFTPLYTFLSRPLSEEMKRQNRKIETRTVQTPFELPPEPQGEPTREDYLKLRRAVEWLYQNRSTTGNQIASTVVTSFWEPFMLRLTMSLIFGFIIVSPLVLWELGMFVAPALTPEERRPLRLMLPVAAIMMVLGVSVAYYTMFFAITWFLSYMSDFPPPISLMQKPNDYVMFLLKMMAVFGLAFQLPVVLCAGAFLGLVTSRGMLRGWRYGVLLAAIAAMFIPTNDLVSMFVICFCILLLYFGSIFLVKIVERMKAKPPEPRPAKP
ncbi:MAG: twin-arginine translocase subunit TatC [Chloroherpetonaceae bacterium]|nr:twin-arginine translocase subunit TatC [Chthonomonadaceae bacterium]MDW8208792.1 twin-arginine translocase subunit TatC [Chloroherpetonaceae bacterium]